MKVNRYWAIAIVLVILLIYLLWRYSSGRKAAKGRGKRAAAGTAAGTAARPSAAGSGETAEGREHLQGTEAEADEEEDEGDEGEEGEEGAGSNAGADAKTSERAARLFKKVHRQMTAGIEQDEFQRLAGADGGGFVFPMLAQLYNKAKQEGRDPLQTITAREYRQVLQDE